MEIKYVGPFLTVESGGYTFTRNVPVTVDDAKLAEAMIAAKDHNGKPHFVSTQSELVLN